MTKTTVAISDYLALKKKYDAISTRIPAHMHMMGRFNSSFSLFITLAEGLIDPAYSREDVDQGIRVLVDLMKTAEEQSARDIAACKQQDQWLGE